MQSADKPSLYDRLGGVYSIATVVDDLIDRVMADPRLNANPLVDEAHHRVPPAGIQVFGDRDGLLGCGRTAKIYGPVDGRVTPGVEDYRQGVGRIHGRCLADAGQIQSPCRGASRTKSNRQQYPIGYCLRSHTCAWCGISDISLRSWHRVDTCRLRFW
jgi:hypothetical protein